MTTRGATVFFGAHIEGGVRSVPRTGGAVTTVAQNCAVVDVEVDDARVYFVCFDGGVWAVDRRPGSTPELLTRGVPTFSALTLGPRALYAYSALEDHIERFPR